jgi:hypothetical protein
MTDRNFRDEALSRAASRSLVSSISRACSS